MTEWPTWPSVMFVNVPFGVAVLAFTTSALIALLTFAVALTFRRQ